MRAAKLFSPLSFPLLLTASLGVLVVTSSVVSWAQTASNSPFASKKKKAWEVQTPSTSTYTARAAAPDYSAPATSYRQPTTPAQTTPAQTAPAQTMAPVYTQPTSAYSAPPATISQYGGGNTYGAAQKIGSKTNNTAAKAEGLYHPQYGNAPADWKTTPSWAQNVAAKNAAQQAAQNPGPFYYPNSAQQYNTHGRPYQAGVQPVKKPWYKRLGLGGKNKADHQAYAQQYESGRNPNANTGGLWGGINKDISGHVKLGAAMVDGSDREFGAETIADIDLRGELSKISQGGTEFGVGLRGRAQRDRHRRGFGGRIGDCPATQAGCASAVVDGNVRAIKGHTGGFHTQGDVDSKDFNFALEGAYGFVRSAYGDLIVGRDDGAAYLFSLGAPSLVTVAGSNSGVDYTGLDAVKTVNDASGFAEKISYTSPRLLGDSIGVGVQFGLSYSPNARACGVDYCVRSNGTGLNEIYTPEMKNIFEGGLSLDRKFKSGFSAELTATYARGSEDSGNAAFDDLSSYGVGLELKYKALTFGGSWLNSNNGIADNGDYSAYDIGLTWKPSNLGFSASYGHAKDDLVNMSSDQAVLAASYDFGKYRLGTGVQYVNRKSPFVEAGSVVEHSDDAVALFLEGHFKF